MLQPPKIKMMPDHIPTEEPEDLKRAKTPKTPKQIFDRNLKVEQTLFSQKEKEITRMSGDIVKNLRTSPEQLSQWEQKIAREIQAIEFEFRALQNFAASIKKEHASLKNGDNNAPDYKNKVEKLNLFQQFYKAKNNNYTTKKDIWLPELVRLRNLVKNSQSAHNQKTPKEAPAVQKPKSPKKGGMRR